MKTVLSLVFFLFLLSPSLQQLSCSSDCGYTNEDCRRRGNCSISTENLKCQKSYYENVQKCLNEGDINCFKKKLSALLNEYRPLESCCMWSIVSEIHRDPKNGNNVSLFYTSTSYPKDWRGDTQLKTWEKATAWKQNHFNLPQSEYDNILRTDLHHLRPVDSSMIRRLQDSNFKNGGSALCFDPYHPNPRQPTKSDCENIGYIDKNTFEPPSRFKGDLARMLFYIENRYQEKYHNQIVNDPGSQENVIGWRKDLYKWHIQDPVDDEERRINDEIYQYQNNRNPFIDHPEWADFIYGSKKIGDQKKGLSGGAIFAIILIVLCVLAIITYFLYKKWGQKLGQKWGQKMSEKIRKESPEDDTNPFAIRLQEDEMSLDRS